MPWTPEQFASRHNHKLKGAAAAEGAKVGNALLREGMPEGKAIRIANAMANRKLRKSRVAKRSE